ncbi:hypothetical protein KUCAC02_015571 [Chaenocephalus aceratus]|uniref:Uncharacterized protein n=1 Tax=Chaenocephalus aceratus TaxID=36190 RepID=A0ACB9XYE7_CHAAC|nr:hypothetical protein KUCAC02_015571 [Chaenocephalus aceratus]
MSNEGKEGAANAGGEGVGSVKYAVERKDKKRMKGSEKEEEETEDMGTGRGNDVEVEMEETEGGEVVK